MDNTKTELTRNENTPRIYVASLADYNAGRLHGRWIDADQSPDAIREQIGQMLAGSKEPIAEDWAIHDYESFGDLRLSEFEDVDQIVNIMSIYWTDIPYPDIFEEFSGC